MSMYENADPVLFTLVTVTAADLETVEDHGSIFKLTGSAGPERITFGGDHRPMRELLAEVQANGEAQANVADYQILAAWVPDFELDDEPDDFDPGPEVDDEGGMSEFRYPELEA